MSSPRKHVNVFFHLMVVAAVAFIVTVLAMVAAALGESQAPLARLLNEYGGRCITVEVVAILALGLLALIVDRRQTVRQTKWADQTQPTDEECISPDPE